MVTKEQALARGALQHLMYCARGDLDDADLSGLYQAEREIESLIEQSQPVPSMTLTEEDAKQQIDAAERVSRMYFDIAAEVLGEDEVRRRRDDYLERDMERVRRTHRARMGLDYER